VVEKNCAQKDFYLFTYFVLQEKLYDFFKELQTLKKAYIIA
jgi:hypothetical protein